MSLQPDECAHHLHELTAAARCSTSIGNDLHACSCIKHKILSTQPALSKTGHIQNGALFVRVPVAPNSASFFLASQCVHAHASMSVKHPGNPLL
jgi:hypothetical protein